MCNVHSNSDLFVIGTESVCKSFGDCTAVKDVTFHVGVGEVLGLVGPNGAGKTTLIRILLGLLQATSGRVWRFGCDSEAMDFTTKSRLGFVLERNGIYDDLSIEDNLRLYAEIYRVSAPGGRIQELLDFVHLETRPLDRAGTLSNGMRQKLALARALLHNPEVLILDEPTAGLDPVFQKELVVLLSRLHRAGKTIVLSSHNLVEVQEVCNRVAFMRNGSIRAAGGVSAFLDRYRDSKKLLVFRNCDEQRNAEAVLKTEVPTPFAWTEQGLQFLAGTREVEDRVMGSLLAAGLHPERVETLPVSLSDVFDLVAL